MTKPKQQQQKSPARDTVNPCALCGWSKHMAIHQPVQEGPRKGQPWGHEYKPKDTQ